MAIKDLTTKKLEDYNDVFADILNTLLFEEQYIDENGLRDTATESIYKTDKRIISEQRRDTIKNYCNEADIVISSFGIENQTTIDKLMPIRIMGYDFGTYSDQIKESSKTAAVHPVITVVLNFTDKEWGKYKSLHDILDIPEKMKRYVSDYKIHVFDIAFLEDDIIDSFQSDFRPIARFFKNKRLGLDSLSDEKELNHINEVIEMLTAFTDDEEYIGTREFVNECYNREGVVNMCTVAQALKDEGRQEGMLKGRSEGKVEGAYDMLFTLYLSGDISTKAAAKAVNITEDEFLKKFESFKNEKLS